MQGGNTSRVDERVDDGSVAAMDDSLLEGWSGGEAGVRDDLSYSKDAWRFGFVESFESYILNFILTMCINFCTICKNMIV